MKPQKETGKSGLSGYIIDNCRVNTRIVRSAVRYIRRLAGKSAAAGTRWARAILYMRGGRGLPARTAVRGAAWAAAGTEASGGYYRAAIRVSRYGSGGRALYYISAAIRLGRPRYQNRRRVLGGGHRVSGRIRRGFRSLRRRAPVPAAGRQAPGSE